MREETKTPVDQVERADRCLHRLVDRKEPGTEPLLCLFYWKQDSSCGSEDGDRLGCRKAPTRPRLRAGVVGGDTKEQESRVLLKSTERS